MRKKIHINWNWLVKETWFFHKGMVVPIVLAFWGSFHIRWNSQPISSRVEAPSSFYHQNRRLLLCFLLWIRLWINELSSVLMCIFFPHSFMWRMPWYWRRRSHQDSTHVRLVRKGVQAGPRTTISRAGERKKDLTTSLHSRISATV